MEKFDNFQEVLDRSPKNSNFIIVAYLPKGEKMDSNSHMAEYDHGRILKGGRVQVWNKETRRMSIKNVYTNSIGDHIKDSSKSLYLRDFIN